MITGLAQRWWRLALNVKTHWQWYSERAQTHSRTESATNCHSSNSALMPNTSSRENFSLILKVAKYWDLRRNTISSSNGFLPSLTWERVHTNLKLIPGITAFEQIRPLIHKIIFNLFEGIIRGHNCVWNLGTDFMILIEIMWVNVFKSREQCKAHSNGCLRC